MALRKTMDVKPGPPDAMPRSIKIGFADQEAEPLDPMETAVAMRDELTAAVDELAAEVTRTGEFMMAQRHPNQRPKLRAVFDLPTPSSDAGVAVRIAHEVNRLGALREALAKEG